MINKSDARLILRKIACMPGITSVQNEALTIASDVLAAAETFNAETIDEEDIVEVSASGRVDLDELAEKYRI